MCFYFVSSHRRRAPAPDCIDVCRFKVDDFRRQKTLHAVHTNQSYPATTTAATKFVDTSNAAAAGSQLSLDALPAPASTITAAGPRVEEVD